MILIADSGSTTTNWAYCSKTNEIRRITGRGINPRLMDKETITGIIRSDIAFLNIFPDKIYYYGAGCGTLETTMQVEQILNDIFPKSSTYIGTDILGAARSLWKNESGLAGIFGTGSNCAYYDGENCHALSPSLGYILGDEGSGANIGKQFISLYLKGKLPDIIAKSFNNEFHTSKNEILNAVYRLPEPSRYLASYVPFLYKHRNHPFVEELIENSFSNFFEDQFENNQEYKKYELRFTGSIAWFFKDYLLKVAGKTGIKITSIKQNPIEGLIEYHTNIL